MPSCQENEFDQRRPIYQLLSRHCGVTDVLIGCGRIGWLGWQFPGLYVRDRFGGFVIEPANANGQPHTFLSHTFF
jgi:hypothetical protein